MPYFPLCATFQTPRSVTLDVRASTLSMNREDFVGTSDLVSNLWNLCHTLRDDGITYHQYVTELTYLLFLKMSAEQGREDGHIPSEYRWEILTKSHGPALLDTYKRLLLDLGSSSTPGVSSAVRQIYENASTALRHPQNLSKLIKEIDTLAWFEADRDGFGDLYEGLLEKNASEKKSGAGQYFTPRPLIDAIVQCVKPDAGELIQDPAAGTAGFLIAAHRYIKQRYQDPQNPDVINLSNAQLDHLRDKAFYGLELVPETHRLALMNLMLHDIEGNLRLGDTLSSDGTELQRADLILSNPPFGTKRGGEQPRRSDFTFLTSNKQLAFVQHIYRGLKPGGRAAVVIPDNVLFEDGVGVKIREDLMNKCRLHTILRLPTGIFYAQGVKTNVLFFQRAKQDQNATDQIWIYDLRARMPSFGKRTLFSMSYFEDFIKKYGTDPNGLSPRTPDEDLEGRWKSFSRQQIRERGDNLDISWIRDESAVASDDLLEPDVIAQEILGLLQSASEEMQALMDELA